MEIEGKIIDVLPERSGISQTTQEPWRVARIIREEAKRNDIGRPLHVKLSTYDDTMSDNDFYDNGKWNYKATPLVDMLIDIHHKALIL